MTSQEFLSFGLQDGQSVRIRLGAGSGKSRTLRLVFRGYRVRDGKEIGRSLDDLVPVFSHRTASGKAGRNYYKTLPTTFENIESIEIL